MPLCRTALRVCAPLPPCLARRRVGRRRLAAIFRRPAALPGGGPRRDARHGGPAGRAADRGAPGCCAGLLPAAGLSCCWLPCCAATVPCKALWLRASAPLPRLPPAAGPRRRRLQAPERRRRVPGGTAGPRRRCGLLAAAAGSCLGLLPPGPAGTIDQTPPCRAPPCHAPPCLLAVTAEVADNGDGTYSVTYTATVAGVYELRITIGECGARLQACLAGWAGACRICSGPARRLNPTASPAQQLQTDATDALRPAPPCLCPLALRPQALRNTWPSRPTRCACCRRAPRPRAARWRARGGAQWWRGPRRSSLSRPATSLATGAALGVLCCAAAVPCPPPPRSSCRPPGQRPTLLPACLPPGRWSGPAEQLAQLLPLEASLTGGSGSAEVAVAMQPARDGTYACRYTGGGAWSAGCGD